MNAMCKWLDELNDGGQVLPIEFTVTINLELLLPKGSDRTFLSAALGCVLESRLRRSLMQDFDGVKPLPIALAYSNKTKTDLLLARFEEVDVSAYEVFDPEDA